MHVRTVYAYDIHMYVHTIQLMYMIFACALSISFGKVSKRPLLPISCMHVCKYVCTYVHIILCMYILVTLHEHFSILLNKASPRLPPAPKLFPDQPLELHLTLIPSSSSPLSPHQLVHWSCLNSIQEESREL